MTQIGELTVFWGGMFSGKTTKLVNELVKAGEGAICFKPGTDDRASMDAVKTHDGIEFPATAVGTASMIFMFLDNQITTIGIEEASLFINDPTLIPTIKTLRNMGYRVIVTGLDLTSDDEPFGQMPLIAAMADECVKLRSYCAACGEKASNSYYTGIKNDIILIGGSEKYAPLCRSCYYGKC